MSTSGGAVSSSWAICSAREIAIKLAYWPIGTATATVYTRPTRTLVLIMSGPAQAPGFDDTWTQWDEAHPRASKDSSRNTDNGDTQATFTENIETFQYMNPWESQVDLSTGRRAYRDGATIDWTQEEAVERMNKNTLRSQPGLRGIVLPLLDQARIWVVLIVTGILVGFVGAWLDVLVAWLGDIRTGRCSYGFFYNENSCCSGLDGKSLRLALGYRLNVNLAGEECNEWNTWGEYLGIRSIAATALIQSIIYVVLAVSSRLSTSRASAYRTCNRWHILEAPQYLFNHTHRTRFTPEVSLAILNGYVLDLFLSPWTLLVKGVGLALAVGSGLSLGKEVQPINLHPAQKRRILSAAASAGVAVAFGSPLGGVLFGLEELDLFARVHIMWRAFVCAVLAAVTLQWTDVFGLAGALLIRLNIAAAVHRHRSWIRDWPLMEVVCVTAFTSLLSYPCFINVAEYLWTRIDFWVQTGVNRMDIRNEGACRNFPSHNRNWSDYGQSGWHRAHPTAWIFSSCAPEGQCIFPGFYSVSVIFLDAMLRKITNAFAGDWCGGHAGRCNSNDNDGKWVGDVFGKEGIYDAWIALHGYPFLSTTVEFRDYGETAAGRMIAREHIISINAHHSTSEELGEISLVMLTREVVKLNGDQLVGYITRDKLQMAICRLANLADQYPDGVAPPDMNYTFVGRHDSSYEEADLSASLDPAPMQLRPAVPLQLVVSFFQKMVYFPSSSPG
ncbi:Cl-channel protein [Rhizoctonia solani AG-1 IA]|uniref:Cl-channel protein n=1 Tax=Thanatephorus cucumeris (strain AG1-IA) TaxID=983506 RepID=L8X1X7_THACA|nr:Cl-channel protein [Rhizoctonia solani AG-1 IA]